MIELKNLKKTYDTPEGPQLALNDISTCIHKGEIFGFIGKSGAGKSSLMHCMNLLERPTSGEVCIDGINLTTLPPAQLRLARQKTAMIFQHFHLLRSKTVYDNIALPLRFSGHSAAHIADKVLPLLELVHLTDKKNYYPQQLSGGQKQRVAIARALVCEPNVLLCDEATSALDPQTTATILDLLQDINQRFNLTIVMITHEMDVIKNVCDRVAILDKGQIIEQSTTLDLFTHPKTDIAKTFISSAIRQDLPEWLPLTLSPTAIAGGNPLLRIAFYQSVSSEPVLATLIKKFDLSINIMQATVEHIRYNLMGIMIVELLDHHQELAAIQQFLSNYGLHNEVMGYVIHRDRSTTSIR